GRLWRCQHIHNQFDQRFFLLGVGFRHQQRQRRQAGIVDHWLPGGIEETGVTMQEIHEQKGAAAFVAVSEWVILHDKVEQVGGLGLYRRIGRFAEYRLLQIAEDGFEAVRARSREQIGGLATRYQ